MSANVKMERDVTIEHAAIIELLDKQAITECLLRYCRGCDRFDLELLKSVYWPEAIEQHGTYMGPAAEFAEWIYNTRHFYKSMSHQISPALIEISGAEARSETYVFCMVVHSEQYEMGAAEYMLGARYKDVFEKRNGEWKILRRTVIWDWNVKNAGRSDWNHMKVPPDANFGAPKPHDAIYGKW